MKQDMLLKQLEEMSAALATLLGKLTNIQTPQVSPQQLKQELEDSFSQHLGINFSELLTQTNQEQLTIISNKFKKPGDLLNMSELLLAFSDTLEDEILQHHIKQKVLFFLEEEVKRTKTYSSRLEVLMKRAIG